MTFEIVAVYILKLYNKNLEIITDEWVGFVFSIAQLTTAQYYFVY